MITEKQRKVASKNVFPFTVAIYFFSASHVAFVLSEVDPNREVVY